jgi:nitrogen-specific signal transduction histidine kinase
MKNRLECILYTQESQLLQRIKGLLALQSDVRHIDTSDDLILWTSQHPESVVLLDARGHEYDDLANELLYKKITPVVIVVGAERSEPLRFAESLGAYAVVPLQPELHAFKTLMRHAFEYAALSRQNRHLKEELAKAQLQHSVEKKNVPARSSILPIRNFVRTLKNFDDISLLYNSVMESFVDSAKVARAALFCSIGGGGYCFRAGIRSLPKTRELSFSSRDRFVQWLNRNGVLISRQSVKNLSDPEERDLLQQHLDLFGAELIIPIHAEDLVSGWIIVGQRITGAPFEYEDLEGLTTYADHIANTLANALQHQQTSLQKVLAETVLHAIPFGVTAVGLDGAIRWMNQEALTVFETDFKEMSGMPAERLSSQVADVLRRALDGAEVRSPVEWRDPVTRRLLSFESRQLISESAESVGAVALIKDVTQQRLLEEKEEQLERTVFWAELAASLSHEVRNPLVAIKTFAQLLPERFEDSEFRGDFSQNVVMEVDRLTGLVSQIHQFAHPPSINLSPIKIHQIIDHAIAAAKKQIPPEIEFKIFIGKGVPAIEGDERALGESLLHLITNSAEALAGMDSPRVEIRADIGNGAEGERVLRLQVADNGAGMPAEKASQAFSPFYTTKVRGMGLGLPIVKRTALDHNGTVELNNSNSGLIVTINLPTQLGSGA